MDTSEPIVIGSSSEDSDDFAQFPTYNQDHREFNESKGEMTSIVIEDPQLNKSL